MSEYKALGQFSVVDVYFVEVSIGVEYWNEDTIGVRIDWN